MTKTLKLEPSYGRAISNCLLIWALKKIEKFFKNVNVFHCPKGAKITENQNFYNQLVACPVIFYWKSLLKLKRMVSNLSKSVHI